ncbi:hypothetical protein N5C93_30825 [Pseudomonas nitroreducens]|uniref:hypothetical protein n=1 Tax=Pseudomonas TaxID=286 RepID=UPI0017854A61|nr:MULTISPECIES: hypothetical protein [Pseudomonas]MBD9634554.1 hypothetical protein [Pseudomonas sp. PDM19]MDG9858420.1 hypothetical protein [Pseudomonas nitroreducens]MDH1077234.1 hypothetical protein [Pseudomonas nitroreducens]
MFIRRLKPTDRTDSFLLAVRIAALKMLAERRGRMPYVVVRHGFEDVIAAGATKAELKRAIHSSHASNWKEAARRTREWHREIRSLD